MTQLISSKTNINNFWDLHSLTVPVPIFFFLLKCDNKYDLDTDDRTLQVIYFPNFPIKTCPLILAVLYYQRQQNSKLFIND